MLETISFPGLELRFLQSKEDTAGSLDMFEMTVHPNARMPVPHYHETWDETVYGLVGTTTWQVDGHDIAVGPAETVFVAMTPTDQRRVCASSALAYSAQSISVKWRRCSPAALQTSRE